MSRFAPSSSPPLAVHPVQWLIHHSAHETNSENENEDSESCSQTSYTRDQAPVDQARSQGCGHLRDDVVEHPVLVLEMLQLRLQVINLPRCRTVTPICVSARTLPDVWSSSERGIPENLFAVLADDPIMLPHCRRCALQNLCKHHTFLLDFLCPRLHLSMLFSPTRLDDHV